LTQYFGAKAGYAKRLAQCESGRNPKAVSKPNRNGTIDYGYMQINSIHRNKVNGNLQSLLDLETNIRVASQIYADWGNFSAWTCSRKI
jgi:soluble lytic murein transglycosylase-like protein